MFGWIHESLRQLITRKYGTHAWDRILDLAKFKPGTENEVNHYYDDQESMRLISAIANIVELTVDEVWEEYGRFLIIFTMETGWNELLRAMAFDLQSFLDSLDALHYFIDHVVYKTKLKGPSFRCEAKPDGTLLLHYYSRRRGLFAIVKGLVTEAAQQLFSTNVVVTVHERVKEHLQAGISEHVVFLVQEVGRNVDTFALTPFLSSSNESFYADKIESAGSYQMTINDFNRAFPLHLCFDRDMVIEHCGAFIKAAFPFCRKKTTRLSDVMQLVHPEITLSFKSILTFRNSLFVFKMKQISRMAGGLERINNNSRIKTITLKGQMIMVNGGNHCLYLCSPNVSTVKELLDRNLHLGDIPIYDTTRDVIMLNRSRLSQVDLNKKLEEAMKKIVRLQDQLDTQRSETDFLTFGGLPSTVIQALKTGSLTTATEYSDVTVLIADIPEFIQICTRCSACDVVLLLHNIVERYDRLVEMHDVFKVLTMMDTYVVVSGAPKVCDNHAERILNLAIGMLMEARAVISPITRRSISIRIGTNSGPITAGMIGAKLKRFVIFGDTVHTARQLVLHGVRNKIQVGNTTRTASSRSVNSQFVFTARGCVDVGNQHGNGIYAHFLERNDRQSVWDIIGRTRADAHTTDGYKELHDQSSYGPFGPVITELNSNWIKQRFLCLSNTSDDEDRAQSTLDLKSSDSDSGVVHASTSTVCTVS